MSHNSIESNQENLLHEVVLTGPFDDGRYLSANTNNDLPITIKEETLSYLQQILEINFGKNKGAVTAIFSKEDSRPMSHRNLMPDYDYSMSVNYIRVYVPSHHLAHNNYIPILDLLEKMLDSEYPTIDDLNKVIRLQIRICRLEPFPTFDPYKLNSTEGNKMKTIKLTVTSSDNDIMGGPGMLTPPEVYNGTVPEGEVAVTLVTGQCGFVPLNRITLDMSNYPLVHYQIY